MGNNLLSPRNAKVFSYNSPDRTTVPSLLPDVTTVKLLIERQDWRGLQQIIQDNKEWLRSPTSSGEGCLIAGKHPLHYALGVNAPYFIIETILSIDPACVERNIDFGEEKGFEAIHYAVRNKNMIEILHIIVKYDGKAIEKVDSFGRLPLHIALLAGNELDIIQYLVVNYPVSIKMRTKAGAFPLHLALEGRCSLAVIKFLIEQNPETTKQSFNSNLPLHVACRHKCSLEVFELLLSYNENAVNCYGEESKPVLHFAVANKCCIDIIHKLIELNEDALLHRDKTGRMPIHYAIEHRVNDDVLFLIMEKAPQSASFRGRGTPGNYPLAMAIEKSISPSVILELIRIYPAATKQKTVFGMFPLRSAIREKVHLEVILSILDSYPDAASETDEHGRVALHYAASRDTPIVLVDALISSYPMGVSKSDRNNQIPLHLAAIRLCSIHLLRLLLDRFRQGARALDKYQFTPLNYIVENNGGLEYYELLVASDKLCMELFPPDPLSFEQGKLPLHQAIEFQRDHEVIDFLCKAYPDGCKVVQPKTGKLALHLAILRPLPIHSLISIEQEYPDVAKISDMDGFFPVHYAIKMKTDSQLIYRLLRNNPALTRLNHFHLHMLQTYREDAPFNNVCCKGNRLLLHFAIDEGTSPENVAEILKFTMPFDPENHGYVHDHYYTWTHILAHTNDIFWKSVELVLDLYPSSVVSLLSEFMDEHQQRAIDIATPLCHRVILYKLHYYARYELPTIKSFHATNISMLKRGIDHFQGKKVPVVLKFISCVQSFMNEIKLRENVMLDDRFIVPLIESHNGDEDYNYRQESIQKRFHDFRYLIVVKAGHQSLEDMICHSNICPTYVDHSLASPSSINAPSPSDDRIISIKEYGRQILLALRNLHGLGIVHTNLHPGHIIDCDGMLKIIDFAFGSWVKIHETVKISYGRRALGYCAPEIAQLYLLKQRSTVETDGYSTLTASTSMDMWSFGAILFYLCTGEELFLTSFERSIDSDQLDLLVKWPLYAKVKRMKKIKDPSARNLIEQLLSIEVRLRPNVDECLSHPFFNDQVFNEDKHKNDKLEIRYVGMPNKFDIFISFRHTPLNRTAGELELLNNGRLKHIKNSKGIEQYLIDDALHCQHIEEAIMLSTRFSVMTSTKCLPKLENVVDEQSVEKFNDDQYDAIFRTLTHAKLVVILLSRFAVNCDALCIAELNKKSLCNIFLFELRVVMELISRGCIESGLLNVAFGDLTPDSYTGSVESLHEHDSIGIVTNPSEWVYQPFFQHFQQDMTLSSGNAFPSKLPDVVVEDLEAYASHYLQKYGFGKLHFPHMSIRELFQHILQMPTIHVQGTKKVALETVTVDLCSALHQKLGNFGKLGFISKPSTAGGFNQLSFSRPQTSAFQKLLNSRIPSPEFNSKTQSYLYKDRDRVVESPLKGMNEIISQVPTYMGEVSRSGSRGGQDLDSRNGVLVGHGSSSINGLRSLKFSAMGSLNEKDRGSGEEEQDVKFFDNPQSDILVPFTSNLQLHQHSAAPKQIIPYFTEIVSLDKTTSEEMMHYLVEKMDARDTEINNFVLEMTLMEERLRLQQLEIHRLRSLVKVTQTLDMNDDID